MNRQLIFLWTCLHFQKTMGFFSTIECPKYMHKSIQRSNEFHSQSLDCTLLMSCRNPYEIVSKNSHEESDCLETNQLIDDDVLFDCFTTKYKTCLMKLKVTMIKNWKLESTMENPCPSFHNSFQPTLNPVPGNCSLFYKCDWGSPILFECPSGLHFNAELRVCDWPWQAQCNYSWNNCPRPYPKCPINYPRTFYMSHPKDCDKFYQCDWGNSYLQKCPEGLHFNQKLQICDWPDNANCQIC